MAMMIYTLTSGAMLEQRAYLQLKCNERFARFMDDATESEAVGLLHMTLYKSTLRDIDALKGFTSRENIEERRMERMQLLCSDARTGKNMLHGTLDAVSLMHLAIYHKIVDSIHTFDRVTKEAKVYMHSDEQSIDDAKKVAEEYDLELGL